MTKQSMPAHWTSYNTDEGPSFLPEDGRTLMISIVLDAGAQKDFEGIRVVVVRRENDGAEMFVKECTDLARSSYMMGLNHRKALTTSRIHAKSGGNRICMAENEKLCTLIFELAPSQTYWGHFARLVLIGHQTSQPSLRVIHDHIEHKVSSTILFLHCNHSAQPEFSPGGNVRKPTRARAHYVRVIPVPETRPPQPTFNLPQPVLSRIVFLAFSDKQKGWRRGLLSCGLVCKSWVYLVDFFFNDFHDSDMCRLDHDPPNIANVARSLEKDLSRSPLISTYSPAKYLRSTRVTNTEFMMFCEAQNRILRYATSITNIAIESTHAFLFQEFYDILCSLKDVNNLRVTPMRFGPRDSGDIRHLTYEEILKIISVWPHLKRLNIVNWKLSADLDSSSSSDVLLENVRVTCPIEDLNLRIGKLTGPLLMRLTGPSFSPPTLRVVRFDAIKGLTNSDFLAFLLRVSPTLVSLSVSACPMWRTSDDEEYAIDTAMPSLTSLETLILEGDLSSEKALIQKVRQRPSDVNIAWKRHCISLCNPLMMRLESVLDAVSVTGWDSIHVYLDTPVGYSPQTSVEVVQAAKARGIDFRLSISPMELWLENIG
ncbi:hypothetical protein J132_09661 [Termitomyces sp. J132]|nr:hypothetical protein H2248_009134 [Termitomyces sp. 'cryptogamus']KNZ73759.1 hypothetical protein J132_09661 [Termitomyces sp. J132]